MNSLTQFKAVYCSGLFIPDASTVSALALLFEKIYLPNNIELVQEFSKKYRIKRTNEPSHKMTVNVESMDSDEDPFSGLTDKQRETALTYLELGIRFTFTYGSLFKEVFESEMYPGSEPLEVNLIKKGKPGKLNTYRVKTRPMTLVGKDHDTFPSLVSQGYIPVVGQYHPLRQTEKHLDEFTAKQLAALLAMKSVEMLIPRTKGVHPEVILEARERLADHLPPFWSSMLKLSVELKKRIHECGSVDKVLFESQELIDTVVRPALIDLQEKMLRERKDWFYKILSPVQKGLKLMIGNPPITQQQLITNALVLGSDIAMSVAENIRTIDALKREAGLTFLLEAGQILDAKEKA